MAVTNNLYPPVIDTYMPAFLIKDNTSDLREVTKDYTVTSYTDQAAYDAAVDQYIFNSDVDGVQELWDEYEIKLAAIDPFDPDAAEKKRLLRIEYDGYLEELIKGTKNEDRTEEAFFADRPDPVQIEKSSTFETTTTTKKNYICRVYFSLSPYNSISEIMNAQVTVRSQLTNRTVLHPGKYPCEVMLKAIQTDTTKITDDKYYIEIKPEDLKGCNFTIDQYYKVQIRFTGTDAEDPGIDLSDPDAVQAIDEWLTRNLKKFSEWSSVCLIRGISEPTVELKDFSEGSATDIYDTIINTQVIGQLLFADPNETETLRSYRVKAYDENDNLLLDSGDIFANEFTDINNFNYTMKYWFKAPNVYHFTLTYTTQNLYTETHDYVFSVIQSEVPDLNLQVTAFKDDDNGRIGMRITRSRSKGRYTGQLIIRRASSKDNFMIWEDMYTTNYSHVAYIDYTWYDYTIESGVFYLYGIQGVDPSGARAPMIIFKKPAMCVFDHIFLTGENKQLKIRFNPSLTSFRRTLSESRVDTIGSKYPFIKRNGYVDYAQFPLGGMISTAMDEDGLFTTKEKTYGDLINYYDEYNEENDIEIYRDTVWEKFFRDKVSNFLYSDSVKLFRSPTEGNFLVRLMDVNFQPNQVLGRRLWSFTSTAYEVDDCTLENYKKYNIVDTEDGGIVTSSGEDEPSTLTPIKRIVFINTPDEFPTIGKEQVLYIYNNEVFVWNKDTEQYDLISIPEWNEDDPSLDGLVGQTRQLYTDGADLYLWNDHEEEYEKISVPIMEG